MKISNYFDIDSIMNRYKSPVLPLKLSTVFTLLVLISCTTHTIDDKPPDNPHGFSSITTKDVLSILLSSNRIEVLDFSPERYSLRTEYFSDSILLKGKSAQNLLDRIEANSI